VHRVAVIGATGFGGAVCAYICRHHPSLELTVVTARGEAGRRHDELYPAYRVPLPAQHIPALFKVCHFSPEEQRVFMDIYAAQARFHMQDDEMAFCTGSAMCHALMRSPFEMTPDPSFLVLGETHREGLAMLVYAYLVRFLGVALDRVGELRCGANEMQRVHPHGMPRGLRDGASWRRLEHAELRLELDDVAPEGLERVANALLVVALLDDGQVFRPRKRGHRYLLRGLTLLRHRAPPSGSNQYDPAIGGRSLPV